VVPMMCHTLCGFCFAVHHSKGLGIVIDAYRMWYEHKKIVFGPPHLRLPSMQPDPPKKLNYTPDIGNVVNICIGLFLRESMTCFREL
jgi:hypothetical protein